MLDRPNKFLFSNETYTYLLAPGETLYIVLEQDAVLDNGEWIILVDVLWNIEIFERPCFYKNAFSLHIIQKKLSKRGNVFSYL